MSVIPTNTLFTWSRKPAAASGCELGVGETSWTVALGVVELEVVDEVVINGFAAFEVVR